MNILEHFDELRTRIIKCLVFVILAAILAYCQSEQLFNLLCKPFFSSFIDQNLIGTGPAEAFLIKIKLSAVAGLIIALPIIFYQLWLFISPGLHDNEKKFCLPFVFFTTALFITGVAFAYFYVLPFAFEFFFAQYKSINVLATIKLSEYISLILKILISFGIIFELPILSFLLARLGLITSELLIKYFRHAVVAIFLLSAILTPPDVVSQFLMAIPLIALYGISIYIVKFTGKAS